VAYRPGTSATGIITGNALFLTHHLYFREHGDSLPDDSQELVQVHTVVLMQSPNAAGLKLDLAVHDAVRNRTYCSLGWTNGSSRNTTLQGWALPPI
jgi:hypothetical protein